jgi:hypothetical protein
MNGNARLTAKSLDWQCVVQQQESPLFSLV